MLEFSALRPSCQDECETMTASMSEQAIAEQLSSLLGLCARLLITGQKKEEGH